MLLSLRHLLQVIAVRPRSEASMPPEEGGGWGGGFQQWFHHPYTAEYVAAALSISA